MYKFVISALLILVSMPAFSQSHLDSLFFGLDLNVPVGTYRSGNSPLAQGLSPALHEQKHDFAPGFRLGYEIPFGEGDFAARLMLSYASHSGSHQLEAGEGVIHTATTKHQILSIGGGVMCTPFFSNRQLYFAGDLSYDAELLDVHHGGLVKKEEYDGKRIALSLGLGHRFIGQRNTWSIEAGLKSTLFGSLDVNGNEYSKRNILYISVSFHL
jgi:hypothetical protein